MATPILLRSRTSNRNELKSLWSEYSDYVATIRSKLPLELAAFADAEYHYDFTDHRSLHDSRAVKFEVSSYVCEANEPKLRIDLWLLGAYGDYITKIQYLDVGNWDLPSLRANKLELSLDEFGFNGYEIIHWIRWVDGIIWTIKCRDFRIEQHPCSEIY
jgi:hypothetical protein